MAILGTFKDNTGAGALDRLITIESYTATRDALGGEVATWTTHSSVWANVLYKEPLSDETQQAAKQQATRKVNFQIRYLSTVTEKMRVLFESEYYDILSITNIGRQVYMLLETEIRK